MAVTRIINRYIYYSLLCLHTCNRFIVTLSRVVGILTIDILYCIFLQRYTCI